MQQQLDNRATLEQSTEMRDFARVLVRALMMIVSYLKDRYHV